MPRFGVRQMISISALTVGFGRFHPINLFAVFDVHVAEEDVRAARMAIREIVVSFIESARDVAVLGAFGDLGVVADRDEIGRGKDIPFANRAAVEAETFFPIASSSQSIQSVAWV